MATNFPIFSPKFCCQLCNIKTDNKKDFEKHLLTSKHKKLTIGNKMVTEIPQNTQDKDIQYICETCNKEYKSRVGLWRHKKLCIDSKSENVVINEQNIIADKDLILMLVKQNTELMEVLKNGTHNNNSNHTNSHNKSFNLQFFLNETCKDAMNIMDFVESIKLQLSDLENVGEVGYVNGISNIIVKNLNELDVSKRPVHCTDKKRETLYVKDENKWEKDDEKKKLRKAIKKVVTKNQRLLLKFKEVHPDCGYSSSLYSDQYNKIIVESMGGSGDNDLEKEEKIIKRISKAVIVEKEP
jgi:hypothetical protein